MRTGSALAALILMWAAPAIAGVQPPAAPAGDAAADDAAADQETADQPAPDAAPAAEAPADDASATESHSATSQASDAQADAHAVPQPVPQPDAPIPAPPLAPPSLAAASRASSDLSAHAVRMPEEAPATPRIGAGLDVGLPDGATASIVVRPIRSIRAHAGLSHNMISLGERAGLTWVPLSWWVSPTLSVEYGHYADGNANPLVRMVTGDKTFSSAVLDRVGYDYANAHAGLEFGRRWFTFYIHGGYSRVTGTVHNLSAETMSQSSGTTSVTFSKDPSVRLWSVSARLGFIVYLAK